MPRGFGPKALVFSPGELVTIGRMFAQGLDTWQIARKMRVPESVVANHLGLARAAHKRSLEEKPVEFAL